MSSNEGSSPTYDVAIVGAGPAGSAAAIAMSQAGLRVALIEETQTTSRKVGESLPGAAIRLLRRLGIHSIEEILPNEGYLECLANVSSWGTRNWESRDSIYSPEGGGWLLDRVQFEKSLRRIAIRGGAEFVEANARLQANSEGETKHKLELTTSRESLYSNWLIDASGRASAIARQFGATRNRALTQMATIGWFKAPKEDREQTTRIRSEENGWWYSSRLPDQTRVVAFHGLPKHASSYANDVCRFVADLKRSELIPYTLDESALLEDLITRDASPSRLSPCCGQSWFAIGDAAISLDPLSSQGIFFALYSAIRAADSIITKDKRAQARASYEDAVSNVFTANQTSRIRHYSMEQRFPDSPYWSQQASDLVLD